MTDSEKPNFKKVYMFIFVIVCKYILVFGPPQAITINPTSNSLYVNWTKPLQGGGAETIISYLVMYDTDGVSAKFLEVYEGTEIIIEELNSNSLYYVSVAAKNSNCRIGTSILASSNTRKYYNLYFEQSKIE